MSINHMMVTHPGVLVNAFRAGVRVGRAAWLVRAKLFKLDLALVTIVPIATTWWVATSFAYGPILAAERSFIRIVNASRAPLVDPVVPVGTKTMHQCSAC